FSDRLAGKPEEFAPHATIVHIDVDPAEIGKAVETDLRIVADAIAALGKMLELEIKQAESEAWIQVIAERKLSYPFQYDRSPSEEIKPQKVVEIIGKITKGQAVVATDVGQHQMWVAQFYPFQNEQQLITSGGLGTMGYGIPAGIGAKL